jgi:hypothetical protein
LVACA